jgi:inner membrane transporter RhtA
MKNRFLNIAPVPSVLLAIVSVQSGAAIAKSLFPALGPATTASLRIGISALILFIAFKPDLLKLNKEQWKAAMFYGLSLGAMNMTFYYAITRIPIGLGVTLEFMGPLLVAVLGSKRLIDFVWIILAGAGIVLISPLTSQNGADTSGILLASLAGGFWAIYIITGSKISRVMKDGEAVSVGMLFATALILPFGIASGGFGQLTPAFLGMGTALALLSSAIPFVLEMRALGKMPPRTFSILMSLEPAMAALCAWLFLNETLKFQECMAIVFVIAASIGATYTARKTRLKN